MTFQMQDLFSPGVLCCVKSETKTVERHVIPRAQEIKCRTFMK